VKAPIHTILTDSPRQELVYGQSFPEYQASVGLNASVLKEGRKSMLHLKHAWDTPRKDTPQMQHGRAVHCLLLEPGEFESRYKSWDGGRRAGNAYKDFLADAEAHGAEVLKEEGEWSFRSVLDTGKAWLNRPDVLSLVRGGRPEVVAFWGEDRMQCKARLDLLKPDVLVDVKTTADIEARAFSRQFYALGYDIQLAWYRRAVEVLTGSTLPVEIIAIENRLPHDIAIVPVPEEVLDVAWAKCASTLLRLRECLAADTWPGVANHQPYGLYVPPWQMKDEEDDGIAWEAVA
jgi:exodeoxyribonuclease VIII